MSLTFEVLLDNFLGRFKVWEIYFQERVAFFTPHQHQFEEIRYSIFSLTNVAFSYNNIQDYDNF